jgi:hypothetical protein
MRCQADSRERQVEMQPCWFCDYVAPGEVGAPCLSYMDLLCHFYDEHDADIYGAIG